MKICMVIWKYFPSTEGGAERQCRKLVNELVRRGNICTVVAAREKRALDIKENGMGGERVVRLGCLSWLEASARKTLQKLLSPLGPSLKNSAFLNFWLISPFTWVSRFSFMYSLKRYLGENAEDMQIIHVHEAHWIAGAVAWAAEGLDIPIVCKEASYPHEAQLSYDTPFRRTLSRLRSRLYFIAITPAIEANMIQMGISRDRVSYIPNGVEIPSERATIIGSISVVYIGNFTQGTHIKAFDILFEAWDEVQRKRKELVMTVLGGGDASEWQNYLRNKGCEDSVVFEGSVSDVGLYLQRARMFVLPSRVEGLSNALLEAMSWGVPVVVSDIPANLSLIVHRKNGLVVPVNDAKSLANAIIEIAVDDDLACDISINTRQTIKEKYHLDVVISSLTQLYDKLLRDQEVR